ncbi:prepilin-type N-terminal cleavage/methylation domain-containing protein [Candidatus Woesebacteria bacterium]|nr:prepilin-type N-terminal cleavage/methylation domain-containing protein [Candidatus Woesebacteria bacterium]
MKKALLARLKSGGFTMIELLIVISILGILAVMVLAAINPLEQINRGRDTAKRGDAEQLLGAFERYNAFNGYFPWQGDETDTTAANIALDMVLVNNGWLANADAATIECPILERLSTAVLAGCVGTDELKASYIDRVDEDGGGDTAIADEPRGLYVYYEGNSGDNAYVCFSPQSAAFRNEAADRCTAGLPADLLAAAAEVCPPTATDLNGAGEAGIDMICLP